MDLLLIVYTGLVLVVFVCVRGLCISAMQLRRLNAIHARNIADINAARSPQEMVQVSRRNDERYEDLDRESTLSLALNLRLWTYKQFFPEEL